MENFYKVLGVQQSASDGEIKNAYVELVTKYHPDVYVGDKDYAEEYTSLLSEAYNTLKNQDSRSKYDVEFNRVFPHSPLQATRKQPPANLNNQPLSRVSRILTSPFFYVPSLLIIGSLVVYAIASYFV